MNAKLGDKDLLTEIQGIESVPKPLSDIPVTYFLELEVLNWLQVGGDSFVQVK